MASQVDVCNLALSNLGDSATVASIDPPEGSAQAEHCARFYPIALATLLESHDWSFTLRRAALTEVTNPSTTWAYAYAFPSAMVRPVAVLDPNASDDYSMSAINGQGGLYAPQDYATETDSDGNNILLTNQASAVLRYTVSVTDTAKFPPLFVESLVCLLESKLAGPVLKGEAGRSASKSALQTFAAWFGQAKASDAGHRNVKPVQSVGWMSAR